MRVRHWTLVLPLASACGEFGGAGGDPGTAADGGTAQDSGATPGGGATPDGGATPEGGIATASPVVVRGVTTVEGTNTVSVQLPAGAQKGDFLWATVLVTKPDDLDVCDANDGWTVARRENGGACATVYSRIVHLHRVAGDAEPAEQSPCVLKRKTAQTSVTAFLAAFGGVDPAQPFEDVQAYAIPFPASATAPPTSTPTLVAPGATASSPATEAFAVFVDPDGHGDSAWAVPSGMTRRAASNGLALFVAALTQAGPTPSRETHKAPSELFCATAEALSVVLHPKP
jgi:hypothetical protein